VQQRLVRDLMRIRHGHVVPESASLREVAERLMISDCDVIAVTDSQGKLSGAVCESSVVRALIANPPENSTIQSIVSRHVESVRVDVDLTTVIPLFRSSANTAIPVIDATGCVCGLLLRRDVIRSLLNRRLDQPELNPAAGEASTAQPPSFSSMIRTPRTSVVHAAETHQAESLTPHQKPHFLRAEDARRILWAAEDRL